MKFARCVALAAVVTGPLFLAACTEPPVTRGYVLEERSLDQIKVGASAQQVILVLGTPSVVSTVGGKGYYYVSQKISRPYQFMDQNITDQRVLAIHLDAKDRVERIANYGMEDGKLFDFISRTTPSGGDELSFVKQLMKASSLLAPSGGGGGVQPGL